MTLPNLPPPKPTRVTPNRSKTEEEFVRIVESWCRQVGNRFQHPSSDWRPMAALEDESGLVALFIFPSDLIQDVVNKEMFYHLILPKLVTVFNPVRYAFVQSIWMRSLPVEGHEGMTMEDLEAHPLTQLTGSVGVRSFADKEEALEFYSANGPEAVRRWVMEIRRHKGKPPKLGPCREFADQSSLRLSGRVMTQFHAFHDLKSGS